MKKRARARTNDPFIVPNSEFLERSARRTSKQGKKGTGSKLKYEVSLLANAYAANKSTKTYDVIKASRGSFLVVRSKNTGRVLSKSAIGSTKKTTAVRKLALRPRAGTIGIKKILDAI